MKVNRLQVDAFRNLKEFTIEPDSSANIICGNNAQGKTNLLEAIWLFTGARSFRGSREKDFIPQQGDLAGLKMDFYGGGREQQAVMRWTGDKRQIQLNGVTEDSASSFNGVFCGVVFSPDHLSLVKDGPEGRRQMIDASLVQAYPKYGGALLNYNKALRQRNTLLKDISFNGSLIELLEVWDEHVINYGGYICGVRDRYIRRLGQYAKDMYGGISGGKESFSLTYEPSFGQINTDNFILSDFKNAVKEALTNQRGEDIRLGITTIGPHRDDLDILVNGISARNFASQGQQRSSVLAMKLAECSILEEQMGEAPVVLLDDVMSELDKNRRRFLLNELVGKQVFITCCDKAVFKDLEAGRVFTINNGNLSSRDDKIKESQVNTCTFT